MPRSQDGETALIKASSNGHLKVVKILLAYKADINAHNKVWTSLDTCVHEAALPRGLVHCSQVGETSLIMASINGHLEVVQELLQLGADSSIQTHVRMRRGRWLANRGVVTV